MKYLSPFFKWLVLVGVLVISIVGGVLFYFYQHTSLNDLPPYEVRFGGQTLYASGYEWFVPVAGAHLGRTFSLKAGGPLTLEQTVTSQPQLELPAGTQSQITILDSQDQPVFEGSGAEYDQFAFEQDGDYTVSLQVGSMEELGSSASAPTGSYQYHFRFTLHCQPHLAVSAKEAVQGNVVGVRLTGILGNVPPVIQCELAPEATFTFHNGSWVCFLPVDYNQPSGEYPITVTSNDQTVTETLQVRGRSRKELDTSTLDGTAAVPYIGRADKKIEELFQIADPDIYWSDTFLQPISGRVVRDYGVLEYVDRVLDPLLLAVQPELAAMNELIQPRRSVNVTMAVTPGRKVVAPAAGRVVFAGPLSGCGRTVVIEHGCALKSIIYLLGRMQVSEGDYVAQGDVIGTSQGHVCCEMRLYDIPISPWEVWRGQGGLFF